MNVPTIIVAAVIAVIFVAVVVSEVRKLRQGRPSCSCGCSGCEKGSCEKNKTT